ncbi:nuclear transport factor 2 family protein, partial [Klebsiella pneumoniae]|uniref:nuclear transport factor 2 family protein n=1 Tax=Klebsiella pneumoniae TaxID=573 RepID=UPI00385356B9
MRSPPPHQLRRFAMSDIQAIASAIDGYFDLMYDVDDSRFRDVFADAAIVHGIRDGKHTVRSA